MSAKHVVLGIGVGLAIGVLLPSRTPKTQKPASAIPPSVAALIEKVPSAAEKEPGRRAQPALDPAQGLLSDREPETPALHVPVRDSSPTPPAEQQITTLKSLTIAEQRALYWEERGFYFNPSRMSAEQMDEFVAQQRFGGTSNPTRFLPTPSQQEPTQNQRSLAQTQQTPVVPAIGTPPVAENGDTYGADNDGDGRTETVYVKGYFRKDGTYVKGHYRAKPRR